MLQTLANNQTVQQISSPSVRGITTGKTKTFGSVVYVEIEIGINDRKFVPQDDLAPLRANPKGIEDLLQNLQFGKIGDLARILIFHKISSNLSNVFYAMQASRTDFHAYQFKSVYKFIESFNNRILIADEVGLGKTIEAGLIWLEAKARSDARRLLVVCPSMLREKWKKELRFRFDTKAEIYDARGLCGLMEDFRREGQTAQFAAICSLNSIRQDSVRTALAEFENTPYKFDLVIIDEAHHLRNTDTKSHAVGKTLSEIAEAMVLLTATPIHLGSQDLYRLLNLLDENEFSELWQFEQMIIENEPVIQAQNLLRYHPPKIAEAREQIEMLNDFPSFRNNSNLHQLSAKLETLSSNKHCEIVEAGLLLEKLNLLSSHISRTRKREVTEWRVVRESNSLTVKFNNREAEFYNAVTEAVQNRVQSFSNKITAFALMMPQRQMASCIPAMVEHYRGNSFGQTAVDEEILGDLGFDAEDSQQSETVNSWLELEQLVAEWNDDTPDSKFDVLFDALRVRFEREPAAKIIVFSYFKKTLRYLNRRLTEEGFAPVMIHGDVPMEERQELIETFRTNPSRRVLLSSEVGSEGIDLQFCRIIFNYDLPWNPMKVEQRIGRVDRLGQKADKISIVNFAVSGTIEEKILHRLYERIGIFERSLGDLEPILGELTQQLSFDLLSQRLSPEQTAARIEQTLLATENKRRQEEELVEQSTVFLGSADYILEQIGAARDLGRRITPEDLRRFIEDFFENSNYYGASLSWNKPAEGFATVKLSNQARTDLHWFCRNQNPPLSTSLTYSGDDSGFLCFDAEQAQSHPQREMLTHFHPLVQWIKDAHQTNENAFFPTAAVEMKTDTAPAGDYLLAVQFWEFQGIKKSKRIEYEIVSLTQGAEIESDVEAEKLLQEILRHGASWEYASMMIDQESLMKTWENCSAKLHEKYQTAFELFRQDNENLKHRRENHLKNYAERKEERLQRAIQTMKEKFASEKQLKGFYAMLEKVRAQSAEEFAKLRSQSRTSEEFKEIAAIVCRIKN